MGLSDRDRKLLWGRSRNLCAFPQCRKHLIEDEVDSQSGDSFESVVGDECHIYSASPDGPRYDAKYPKHKLETYENRILLCKADHARVDARDGRGYDAATLIKMKRDHEKQEERRERIGSVLRAYVADQYSADDKVLFRQVKLEGPRVDAMFVDVPMASRGATEAAALLSRIAAEQPGDADPEPGSVVAGAAQTLLHPEWKGNALIVGGPGQGKSTLLQFICQFHRARFQNVTDYTGAAQGLSALTATVRVPIRLDLRDYAQWASAKSAAAKRTPAKKRSKPPQGVWAHRRTSSGAPVDPDWPELERFLQFVVGRHSGDQKFGRDDLTALLATEPILLALDGLDEVANLDHRDVVASEIERASARLRVNAFDLMVVVATRPGMTKSPLWSSPEFPIFHLQRLTAGLRLQYLQRWCKVAELDDEKAGDLQRTFVKHEGLPHIRDLASYPMQLAILLHLLHRRGLLPQQRTDLYGAYLETFLDREQTENKESLLSSQRDVIVDIHAFLGWHLQQQAENGQSAGRISRADLKKLLHEHLAGHEKGQELAKQLFSAMESRVLCLVEREPGYFQFEVQSLREYFAAAYVDQYADPRGTARVDCFDALLERPYWLNTCRFFVGMFGKMEVRGIRQSLLALHSKSALGVHPHLRVAAARLLDDRAYQTQPDSVIRDVIDFVLDGPGVLLAEDGFLDESGQPLTFAEDAGRSQAALHLRKRLLERNPEGIRLASARMLRRHTDDPTELARWWWDQFKASGEWIRTAADLGVMDAAAGKGADFAAAVRAGDCDDEWACEVLARGGYAGGADDVLSICKDEFNDGAVDVLFLSAATPLGKLVDAARLALLRPPRKTEAAGSQGRTRFRRASGRTLVADVVTGSEPLRARPQPDADGSAWQARLEQISKLWGDGWLLRQVVALVPIAMDLDGMARVVAKADPTLAKVLRGESEMRGSRKEVDWWRQQWGATTNDFEKRCWLFRILTAAQTQAVLDLGAEIDAATAGLSPKHYRAMEAAVQAFQQSSLARTLVLQESLRRAQVTYSGRTIWLLRLVSTEGAIEQIDKKMQGAFAELLAPGMGDRRPLMRVLGNRKTVPINSLENARGVLPAGGWADGVKLGAMNGATAKRVLEHPEAWPLEVADHAIQQSAAQLAKLPPVSELAVRHRWFDPPAE